MACRRYSNLGLNSGSTKDIDNNGNSTQVDKTTTFSLNPQAGYFFINNLAVGIMINLTTETYSPQNGTNTNYNLFDISPFVRYYYDLKNSKFKPFVDANIDFGSKVRKLVLIKQMIIFSDGAFIWGLITSLMIMLL